MLDDPDDQAVATLVCQQLNVLLALLPETMEAPERAFWILCGVRDLCTGLSDEARIELARVFADMMLRDDRDFKDERLQGFGP